MPGRNWKYVFYSKGRKTSSLKFFVLILIVTCLALQTLVLNIEDSKGTSSQLPALNNQGINSNQGHARSNLIKRSIISMQKQFAEGVSEADEILLGAKIATPELTSPLETLQRLHMPINAKLLANSDHWVPLASQMGHKSGSTTASQLPTRKLAPKGYKVLLHNPGWASLSERPSDFKETFHWQTSEERFIFNCSNIHEVKLRRLLGNGVTKQVYLGIHGGRHVAVKMVTSDVIDVLSCTKHLSQRRNDQDDAEIRHRCFALANMKLMKEILLLLQLHHPGIQGLLGYCVRSEETVSRSMSDHGVIAVYEYGIRFYLSTLHQWAFAKRIETARHLAHLLVYLEHSPLGSLRVSDFKEAHFLLTDGLVKLTDFDDVTSAGVSCPMTSSSNTYKSFVVDESRNNCAFGSVCDNGVCSGYNARYNLYKMNEIFFQNLLYCDTNATVNECEAFEPKILHLRDSLMKHNITSAQLYKEVVSIKL